MIHALSKDPLCYLWGWWYKTQEEAEGTLFSYKLYDDTLQEDRYARGRNIVGNSVNTRIETDFDLPFSPGQYVALADGQMYYIDSVATKISPAAYQALGVLLHTETDKILTLTRVKNMKAAQL